MSHQIEKEKNIASVSRTFHFCSGTSPALPNLSASAQFVTCADVTPAGSILGISVEKPELL